MSSKAEFGNLGLDPSHLSFVLSSDGTGKKVNVDITTLPLVEFVICKWEKREREKMNSFVMEMKFACVIMV